KPCLRHTGESENKRKANFFASREVGSFIEADRPVLKDSVLSALASIHLSLRTIGRRPSNQLGVRPWRFRNLPRTAGPWHSSHGYDPLPPTAYFAACSAGAARWRRTGCNPVRRRQSR